MGPGRTLEDTLTFLRRRDDADPAVAPAMRSYVLRGDPGAGIIVLLHGLTSSPPAWRAVAELLAARGRTVVVPRLFLHGYADRMTPALLDLTPAALIADTSAIVEVVAATGEDVTIAGHSLGATLALDVAARLPLARVVAVAPFLGIARIPLELHALMVPLMSRAPQLFLWWDPRLRERLAPAHGYPRYPLQALVTGVSIADLARREVPQARAIDFVLNAGETSVNNRTALRLAATWRRSGASIAVHRLRGLGWSHDIIEPERPAARRALAPLVAIIDSGHAPDDRDHVVTDRNASFKRPS